MCRSRIRCRTDRKSTRLNSSHVEISYAVFCLKKKKGSLGQSYGINHLTMFCSAAYSPTRINTSKAQISPITFFQQGRDEMLEDRFAIAEWNLDWIVLA